MSLENPSVEQSRELTRSWMEYPPTQHTGYLELLEHTPDVIFGHLSLSPAAQAVVAHHTIRTSLGMASVVDRTGSDGVLRLGSTATATTSLASSVRC